MDAFVAYLLNLVAQVADFLVTVYEWLGPHAAVGVVAVVVLVVMVVQTERGSQEDS